MADRLGWRLGSGLPMSPRWIKGTVYMLEVPGMTWIMSTGGMLIPVTRCTHQSVREHLALKVRLLSRAPDKRGY